MGTPCSPQCERVTAHLGPKSALRPRHPQELEVLLRHRDFNIQKHARQLSHLPSLPTYAEFEAHAQQDFDAVRWVVEAAVQAQDLIDKMGLVDVAGRDDIHERALQDIMSVLNGGRPLPK